MAFVSKRVHIRLISNAIQTSDRLAKVLSLILYLSILVIGLPISEANSTCTVNGIQYLCKNIATETDFPSMLPTNVRKVSLKGTNVLYKSFPAELFNHETWANASELSVMEFTSVGQIERGFLDGLEKLKFLSISSCTDLEVIDPDTFHPTPNIEELHLDGNRRLKLSIVEAALTNKLSTLRYLSLIGIQSFEQHVVMGDNFVKALHRKNLTYLDISGVKVIYVQQTFKQNVFANLKYLNLTYSTPVLSRGIINKMMFFRQNIEVLDFTGVQYNIGKYTIQGEEKIIDLAQKFPKTMYLFAQGMVTPNSQIVFNVRYIFENCNIKFPKMIDFSKNNLKLLNISFIGACRAHESETLNLASNNMEYISPNCLSAFSSLKILDLSNNQLVMMQDFDDFSNIFSQNKDLEIIFLRNNHLTFVPLQLFLSNSKLRIIDLSENELAYFNINLRNAENLKLINLRNNRLKSLSVSLLEQLDALFQKQNAKGNQINYVTNVLLKQFQDKSLIGKMYRYGHNASEQTHFDESHSNIPQYVMIDILENHFVCDCDTLVFMECILLKNIDIVNKTELSCKYGNNEKLLNNELFQVVQMNCRLASRIVIGVASSIVIILIIFAIAMTIRLRRKSVRRNQDLENLKKELLQENGNFKFLVFLSYCSKDAQIVDENILPSLNRYLYETFNTKKDLVCTGENDFVPGMRIIEEIHRCINKSLVVVSVITPAFLQSDWSQAECVAAVDRHRQVVILMKKHTDTSRAIRTIQYLLGQYTRGTWSDNEGVFVIRPSWNTICEGILCAASEALRQYRTQNLIEPAEDNPLVQEIV
ncbi:hypothetical protein ACJMK2_026727 [Sinanodonta woodiana]|uniref:TIR domain-containing protein n=1 Tax=Sinanodonta woodiana TaxID=1069815 RepID=A0ABD3XKP5_SINWO